MISGQVHACECGDHAFSAATFGMVCLFSPNKIDFMRGKKVVARRVYLVSGRWTAYASFSLPKIRRPQQLHAHLLSLPKGFLVDHKNGDTMDNRDTNLRGADPSQNMFNKAHPKHNKLGFIGVHEHKRHGVLVGYTFCVVARGKSVRRHGFKTPEEAAVARDEVAIQMHGEFAVLNYPDRSLRPAPQILEHEMEKANDPELG